MIRSEAVAKRALPIGIAERARMLHDVRPGEVITFPEVAPDDTTFVYRLRMMQESLYGGGRSI